MYFADNGVAYGWGSNEYNQIKVDSDKKYVQIPLKYNINEGVQMVKCGKNITVLLLESNKFVIQGETNSVAKIIELDSPEKFITNFHVSLANVIYIIGEKGVYQDFEFIQFDDERDMQIILITSGSGFMSYVTDNGKFFTTYEHKQFTEISKFSNMKIIGMSSGLFHIIVHAVPQPMETIIEESVDSIVTQNTKKDEVVSEIEIPEEIPKFERNLFDTSNLEPSIDDSDSSHPGSECTVKYHPIEESEDENLKQIERVVDLVKITEIAQKLSPKPSDDRIKIIDLTKGEAYNVVSKNGELQKVELITSSSEEEPGLFEHPNEIRFIDNGIDVTNEIKKKEAATRGIRKSEKPSILRSSKIAPTENTKFILEDRFLGEKLTSFHIDTIRDSKSETQRKLQDDFNKSELFEKRKVQTPMPKKSQRFLDTNYDEDSVDEDRMTTASTVSEKFKDSLDNSVEEEICKKIVKKSSFDYSKTNFDEIEGDQQYTSGSKVKKMFREFKESSCNRLASVANCECIPHQYRSCNACCEQINNEINVSQKNSHKQNQKTSQICNII